MGLAIATGVLADLLQNDAEGAAGVQEKFEVVNRVLRANGLPEHREPLQVPASIRREQEVLSFSYSCLHHLRRAYAHRLADPSWVARPFPKDAKPTDDPLLQEEAAVMDSHLLCHSDCEGYYVPIDFDEVLIDDEDELAGGGMLGSSQALKRELAMVAPALGIQLVDGHLSDAQVTAIEQRMDHGDGLYNELRVWLCLFEACTESIAHRTAICFC